MDVCLVNMSLEIFETKIEFRIPTPFTHKIDNTIFS